MRQKIMIQHKTCVSQMDLAHIARFCRVSDIVINKSKFDTVKGRLYTIGNEHVGD